MQLISSNLAVGYGILLSHLLTTLDTWCRRTQSATVTSEVMFFYHMNILGVYLIYILLKIHWEWKNEVAI